MGPSIERFEYPTDQSEQTNFRSILDFVRRLIGMRHSQHAAKIHRLWGDAIACFRKLGEINRILSAKTRPLSNWLIGRDYAVCVSARNPASFSVLSSTISTSYPCRTNECRLSAAIREAQQPLAYGLVRIRGDRPSSEKSLQGRHSTKSWFCFPLMHPNCRWRRVPRRVSRSP